ncbi:ABC transporter ATP-binding protein [Pontibacillus salipaludis]|uniref:ABC transporter ATP-binding protein n=1 Tax=Pontibacillus salipaludis TaxID=1697394 RepID=UPI0031E7A33B
MLSVTIHEAGYNKNNLYVRDVQFVVNQGEIVGLTGSNGAGKSTSIKTILGLMDEFKGEVTYPDGYKISYIPEEPILYEHLTLWEHLEFAAASQHMPESAWKENAYRLLETFQLRNVTNQLPIHFSKGMKQKTLIVLGAMVKPDIYIIDEPFIGLDPIATKNLISLLISERNDGAAILMSTHVLDSAEKLCDRFILMAQGTVITQGDMKTITSYANKREGTSLLDCFYEILESSHD